MNELNTTDVIRESVTTAIDNMIHAMEPQIHELATKTATLLVERGRMYAHSMVIGVQKRPWYLVGAAALLIAGAVALISHQPSESIADESKPDRLMH
jgi:hypothetical protein